MLNRAKSGAAGSHRLEVVNHVDGRHESAMERTAAIEDREEADAEGGQPRRLPGYAQMHTRNREIGALLKQARTARDESSESVAKVIGTSRRRYAAMERGEALIGAVELDVLRKHFGIPASRLWYTEVERGEGRAKVGKRGGGKVLKADSAQAATLGTAATGSATNPGARLVLVEVTAGEEVLIRTKAQ